MVLKLKDGNGAGPVRLYAHNKEKALSDILENHS